MRAILERFTDHEPRFLTVAQGGLYLRPTLVHTVLGSCVSVTLRVPHLAVAGAFHALLPNHQEFRNGTNGDTPYKYVDTAIRVLAERIFRKGVTPGEIECKVFGGASALFAEEMSVGRRNVEAAFRTLAELGIRVAASNVGGVRGRKLLFATGTGEAFVKYLHPESSGNACSLD